VKTQIFREPSLKSGEINIETVQGVVRLSGFVTSGDKLVTAGQMAASVQRVASVENNQQVK
jgi:osmotically-inducible protein OsmY